jgi:hypothetical protein
VITLGDWTPQLRPPKTEASKRTLPLDDATLKVIDAHLARQDAERQGGRSGLAGVRDTREKQYKNHANIGRRKDSLMS